MLARKGADLAPAVAGNEARKIGAGKRLSSRPQNPRTQAVRAANGSGHRLERETFKTSRLLDFCSEHELTKQIGHGPDQWPLVILKELVDNAIDAAEEAGVAPKIKVDVTGNNIIIEENGPGIALETVTDILDFAARVSSREAYASPTRGAQGNALKTIVAMAFALDGREGETVIESRGTAHEITFRVDHLRQQPKLSHTHQACSVKSGTRITVKWPVCACSKLEEAKPRFLQMAEDYGWLNPHLSMSVTWDRVLRSTHHLQSNPEWAKWRPSDPTSPHWYDEARLRRLMGAQISRDQDLGRVPRTVREFVSEFRGLSGTAKQKLVLEEADAARLSLAEFFGVGERVNSNRIAKLLVSMQRHSRPVKPKDLGLIGKDHLAACFKAIGVEPATFKYQRAVGESEGLPEVIETAFGWCPNGENKRRIITGLNWSVAIGNPFRSLGSYGESLDSILAEQRSGREEPIVFVRPRQVGCRHPRP